MNIVLLGASFTTNNLGVWALASGAINAIYHAYPQADVTFLDYNKSDGVFEVRTISGTKRIPLTNIRFSKRIWLKNHIIRMMVVALAIRLIPGRKNRDRARELAGIFGKIIKADFACAISGGDSFSDIYGIARLIYVTLPQFLCLLLEKDLVLLPQTLGPFKNEISKLLAKHIINTAKCVYSRDFKYRESNEIDLCGIRKKIEFCPDVGFMLEPDYSFAERIVEDLKSKPIIGVNISGLLMMGGYNRKNMFKLLSDYHKLTLQIINLFVGKHNAKVLLIPHVYGNTGESDVLAIKRVIAETGNNACDNLVAILDEVDHYKIKGLIGKCDFFVGARMHACIAGLSQNVPTVGLAYSDKFKGVFEVFGNGLTIDLREHREDEVIRLIELLFQRRIEIRNKLESKVPDIVTRSVSAITRIGGTVM
jgi:colanic acid/amylovoran biosynthesis protein